MSSFRNNASNENTWEFSKENIQPLKSGRTVPLGSNENELKEQQQKFEEEIRMNESDDPLEIWYRYIKWTEQNFPVGKDCQLRRLVQKCLVALKEQEQYCNDVRWWFVWHKFACLSANVGCLGIFEYMHSNGQCTRLASFYKQWAFELEQAEDFTKATEVYKKGIAAEARPLQDLENAFREFEYRIGRKLMSQSDEFDGDEATRNVLGVLKGVGKKRTAPIIRQSSSTEGVTLKSCATPAPNAHSYELNIFKEPSTKPTAVSQITNTLNDLRVNSIDSESMKENFRKPGIWTNQKVKLGGSVSTSKIVNGSEFNVYVDESQSSKKTDETRCSLSTNVLKPVCKTDSTANPLQSMFTEGKRRESSNNKETKEVFAFNEKLVYYGIVEMSFEELRASRYQTANRPVQIQTTASTPVPNPSVLPTSAKESSFAFVDKENQFVKSEGKTVVPPTLVNSKPNPSSSMPESRKSSVAQPIIPAVMEKPNPFALNANTSFTSNVIRDAYAVFSNTLPIAQQQSYNESDSSIVSRDDHSCDHIKKSVPDVPVTSSLQRRSSRVSSEIEEKENIKPPDMLRQSFKRQTSGVLTPALDVVDEQVANPAVEIEVDDMSNELNATGIAKIRPALDEFEPTVAGLMKTLMADRAASTPCHNASRALAPSFSVTKPWEMPNNAEVESFKKSMEHVFHDDSPEKPEPQTQHQMQVIASSDASGLGQHPTSAFINKKLSTIIETSREYRSRSCSSSSSSGSSGDAHSTRKRLLCSSTTSTNLQTISEQLSFAHCTPSSNVNCSSIPAHFQDFVLSSTTATTPNDMVIENVSAPAPDSGNIVRRLYTTDDVDENVERTGMGTKILLTSRINPWDDNVVATLLGRLPKRLDTYTNFHHFAMNLPAIKVGRTLDLGGEIFAVENLIGQGAFAKVFRCVSTDENYPSSPLVMKVQKPCCPWEFYVTEELRRRLLRENALAEVDRSLLKIKDAYIFNDGSVLMYDFCPYGNLLDVVNSYKKNSSSMDELLIVWFTIELLKIVEYIHRSGIIHADIKPDNFLFCGPETWFNMSLSDLDKNYSQSLCLIDFGRAIDMNLMPTGTTFTGKVNTSGFQCCEMLDNKPWTYQTDYFGLLGTVHVLLYNDYMRVYKSSPNGRWKISSTFKRKWNVDLWKKFFDTLLNIPDCNNLPNLSEFRFEFEEYFNSRSAEEDFVLHEAFESLKTFISS